MSDCYVPDEAYEAGIDSLIRDINKLQDENYALEQRYQQLEQVAKRMYKYIKHNAESSLDPTMFAAKQYYREDLESLGLVSLDD